MNEHENTTEMVEVDVTERNISGWQLLLGGIAIGGAGFLGGWFTHQKTVTKKYIEQEVEKKLKEKLGDGA